MNPKVSIIIATYNRASFLPEMLSSIINQTFSNWECLIVDDGCTDNTVELIKSFLQNDSRFQYYLRLDSYSKGTSGCRNYGLDLAKGDNVIFFDDDDIAHPQNLELCIAELSNNKISFCRYIRKTFFGDFLYDFDMTINYNSFYIGINDIEKVLKYQLPLNSCAIMWRKECFKNSRFNEAISYADEWELYTRILSRGINGISIDKCLFFGRKHHDSITGEYFRNDLSRKQSYRNAILLVLQNLKEKQLLTYSLTRYFITLSLEFKETRLFDEILRILDLTNLKKMNWYVFYKILPLRLYFYKKLKKVKKG